MEKTSCTSLFRNLPNPPLAQKETELSSPHPVCIPGITRPIAEKVSRQRRDCKKIFTK